MATVFKTFLNNDVATTRTLLNEAIPIDGKIMFGSYFEPPISGETSNIKTFPHEMFQSVYDYPFLKSSSNHIFDITLGYASDTLLDTDEVTYPDAAQAKKRALYNQFAQVLVGHDKDGNILKFDEDGNILEGGDKYDEAYLLSVARLLNKDEMKKGSFYLQLDFAVTEPGQRLYTDPGSPPTWPVAENPTLSFKDFAAKTSCPAGFFEYNAGANAQVNLISDDVSSDLLASGDSFTIDAGSVTPVGNTYGYSFVAVLGVPADNTVQVLVGADDTESLQNLTNAIVNSENLTPDVAGIVGSTYAYGTNNVGPHDTVTASFNGTDTVSIVSKIAGAEGENVSVVALISGPFTGFIGSTAINNGTPGAGESLALSADTLINSDDYRRISMIITDEGAQNDYRVNSPAGDYGILKIKEYKIEKWDAATNTISDVCVIDAEAFEAAGIANPTDPAFFAERSATGETFTYDRKVGLVYYQAGVIAITPYVFADFGLNATNPLEWSENGGPIDPFGKILEPSYWDDASTFPGGTSNTWSTCQGDTVAGDLGTFGEFVYPYLIDDSGGSQLYVDEAWEQAPIDSSTGGDSNATGFRRRMVRMAFNNTTELNSSIYFCRLNNNEFNYSANPTYLNESKIRVKETTLDAPVSYVTTVGLYSADNELLAQAKLSEPVRKDPTSEFVLRVRLDY